jgi:hypothetical protein
MTTTKSGWGYGWITTLLRYVAAGDLTHGEVVVLLCLRDHSNYRDGRDARPGNELLAQEARVSGKTVQRALADGVRLGLIEQVRRGGGAGDSAQASSFRIVPIDEHSRPPEPADDDAELRPIETSDDRADLKTSQTSDDPDPADRRTSQTRDETSGAALRPELKSELRDQLRTPQTQYQGYRGNQVHRGAFLSEKVIQVRDVTDLENEPRRAESIAAILDALPEQIRPRSEVAGPILRQLMNDGWTAQQITQHMLADVDVTKARPGLIVRNLQAMGAPPTPPAAVLVIGGECVECARPMRAPGLCADCARTSPDEPPSSSHGTELVP